jgi:N-methylhydantoinase A
VNAGGLKPSGGVRTYCIGIDVGGTFTDAVLSDGEMVVTAKALTTPDSVDVGVLNACRSLAERCGVEVDDLLRSVSRFGLGTTIITNILAQRNGRRVGLITTRGFETTIPNAKGARVHDEDGWNAPPAPVVPIEWIRGVDERIDREGKVIRPLDPAEVVVAVRSLVEQEKIEAIVVSFLWAFRNPVHEELAVAALRTAFPSLKVVSAAKETPIIREFERTSIAILDLYVGAGLEKLEGLEVELKRRGLKVPLLLIHSGGGCISLEEARRRPIALAASGPAAGVAAAAEVARVSGAPDVITCDVGGTSVDLAVVSGAILRRTRGELMGMWTTLSMVDVQSIGSGGGSVGWIDTRGMLRVGPRSAGAKPGPACYGRGGTEATVTDALVVLGYIDPVSFLGGTMPLDPSLAYRACETLGRHLGLKAHETAWGIRQLTLEGIVKAVRSMLISRGVDPRTHAFLSYGGAGALFAGETALSVSSPKVIVPRLSSVLSAFGCAATDILRERVTTIGARLSEASVQIQKAANELRTEVRKDLAADTADESSWSVTFEADLRFQRQVWEVAVPCGQGPFDEQRLTELEQEFRVEYERRYGRGVMSRGVSVEILNLRAIGVGSTVHASLRPLDGAGREEPVPKRGSRPVRIGRHDWTDVPVVAGADLRPGHVLAGPILVDAEDTTIWTPAGMAARVDHHGTLMMEVSR